MVIMERYKNAQGQILSIGSDKPNPNDGSIATPEEVALYDAIIGAQEQAGIKWQAIYAQWDVLTVTTLLGHTFAANKEAMRLISFKANNMGDTAVILWEEDWGQFNTSIIELKEALNLAADAHQTIINSVFGV
jgi:hypothetical protein